MSDNPYEKVYDEQFGKTDNPYETAADSFEQQAQFAASEIASEKNPDQHAKVLSIAEQLGSKSKFVEENYDVIEKQRQAYQLKGKLGEASVVAPLTSEFTADPDNLTVAKDDLDELIKLEKKTKEHGFWSQALSGFKASAIGVGSALAKSPSYLAVMSNQMQQGRLEMMGLTEDEINFALPSNKDVAESTKFFRENEFVKGLDQKAADLRAQAPMLNQSTWDSLKRGDMSQAGQLIALNVIASSPSTLGILAAASTGYGALGLGAAGLSTASESFAENVDKPGVSVEQASSSASLKGTFEAAFESLGTMGILKTWEKALTKEFGKQTSKEVMLNVGKTLSYSFLAEGNEEAATSFAQDFADYATGVNKDAMKGSFERAINAGLVGGFTGVGLVSPVGIQAGLAKQSQIRQAKTNQELYQAIGESAENSKLKQRLPEKYREFVEKVTKDGPVEKVYINQEGFTSYFQSKNMTPEQAAIELGISKEYNKAVESGSDIEVSTAVMAEKVAGTEYYQGLKDDVKFNPEEMTMREARESEAETKRQIEEEYNKAKEGKTNEEVDTVESSAREVGKNIEQQLKENGFAPKAAKAQALLYEKFFAMQGMKSGQMPLDLFNKYGLKINTLQDETVDPVVDPQTMYNQSLQEFFSPSKREDRSVDFTSQDGKTTMNMRVSKGSEGVGVLEVNNFNYNPELTSDTNALIDIAIDMARDNKAPLVVFSENSFGNNFKEGMNALRSYGFRPVQRNGKTYMQYVVGKESQFFQSGPQVSDLGFYSKFEKMVLEKVQGKSTDVNQVKAMMKELKEDEVKWLGLNEFIKDKTKIDKQELLDFIRANSLNVVEVTKGGDQRDLIVTGPDDSGEYSVLDQATGQEVSSGWSSEDGAETEISLMRSRGGRQTQYSKYTLPGGENYREVLLTMPPKEIQGNILDDSYKDQSTWEKSERSSFKRASKTEVEESPEFIKEKKDTAKYLKKEFPEMKPKAINELLDKILATTYRSDLKPDDLNTDKQEVADKINGLIKKYNSMLFPFPKETVYKRRDTFDGSNLVIYNTNTEGEGFYTGKQAGQKVYFKTFEEAVAEIESQLQKTKDDKRTDTYKSSHFEEKNILAHVRLNDRVDADGKKVLFVEEIQSDWHQAGRKKGYRSDSPAQNAFENFRKEMTDKYGPTYFAKLTDEERSRYDQLVEPAANEQGSGAVPDAPFKKTWHEFALKRIMRMAAEGGYERVAWTTGEQQAERFDLSKQIDRIVVTDLVNSKSPHPTGGTTGYYLTATDKGGSSVIDRWVETKEDLSDYIGKEAADKILKPEFKSDKYKNYSTHILENADLKVGGEGMKGFYDNILIKSAEKLFKKFGVKVGETEVDDQKVHSLDVTPELKDAALNQGFELYQETRGRIRFGNNRQFNIDLFKTKDESTFLHESAHFFFEVMADLAEAKNAPDSIKNDYQKMLDFVGVKTRSEVQTDQHEKIARAFEAYLMEGKAPSESLKKAFATFKQWLISIYQRVKNLNVEMTPEITEVFDRMLATDEEIQAARSKLGVAELFAGDPKRAGLTDEETLEYLNAQAFARIDAEADLQAQVMKDLIRKKDKAYQAKYKEIYDAEMAKAKEMPEFKAIDLITGEMKLSKNVVNDQYSVFKNTIPRGSTILDGGQHPDVVASILGFENGQAMLQAIAPYQRGIESFVESRVATEIKKTYPELLESPELSETAIRALHNENARKLKRLELKHLMKNDPDMVKNIGSKLIRRMPSQKEVKQQAINLIASTSVREVRPAVHRAAEKRFSIEAAKAFKQGDFFKAFEAKRKEYLNFELYVAAMDAQEDVKKSINDFKKIFKRNDEDMAKSRDVDLVNAAKAILADFGIMRAGKTADEYLKSMQAYDPEGYSVVKNLVDQATANKGDYQSVTYDTFVEMRNAVMALYDLAKSRKEIEIDGVRMDIDKVKEELTNQIASITPEAKSQYSETVDKWGQAKMKLLGFKSSLVRAEAWTKAMDVKDNGPFHRYIWQPVSDAVTNYRLQKNTVLKQYVDLLRGYEKNITQDKIVFEEGKFIFKNKAELMMAILHSGNESNLKKLLLGRGWGEQNADGTVNTEKWFRFLDGLQENGTLTKADFDFAQSIWDMLEGLKPGAQKAHKQMFGYYFNEITANAIPTRFGDYRGGYIPAKVDVLTVEDGRIRQEREEFENNNNSFQFPTTGRGFTKSRVENYTQPLSLDMGLLGSHIDGVLRFTFIEPRVKEVSKIVVDKGFRAALANVDSMAGSDILVPWLQRAAQQKTVLPSEDGIGRATDAVARVLRRNVATQIMMGNVTNTLQQVTGLVVAMSKVNPKYIRNGLWDYVTNNKGTTEAIMEKSAWMKSTQGSNIFELHQAVSEILLNPSTFEKAKDFTQKHTYFLQMHAQNMVNTIVWKGAYDQSIEKGMTEIEAVRFADEAIRTTQGTNNPEDVSRFETGTATGMLFKQFVSYFNMLANLNGSEIQRIQREVGLRKGMGRGFYLYLTAFMLPAVLSEVIVRAMSNNWDDDDDDKYLDDAMTIFFGSQFKTSMAMVPYVGQAGVSAYNKAFTKNVADDRLSLSPVISIVESAVSTPAQIYKDASDRGELKKKTVKDSLQMIGIMTGLPTGPLGRPAGYLMDVESGKAKPSGPVDFTRGLITGKAGDQ